MLSIDRRDAVTWMTLENSQRRNALSPELVTQLRATVDVASRDGSRLVVLRGQGKAFCAGFDLSELSSDSHGDLLLRIVEIEQLLQAIYHSPVPTVALAHGACFGAGGDLFAACSYRICAPDTKFLFPGPRFGLVLGSRRLAARVGSETALRLVSEARQLDAAEALNIGLVTEIAQPDAWENRVTEIAARLLPIAPGTQAQLASVLREDHRDADLADLVRSAAAAGFKDRLVEFAGARR